MKRFLPAFLIILTLTAPGPQLLPAQSEEIPVRKAIPVQPDEVQRQGRVMIVFNGLTAISEREARDYLSEQINGLNREGLTLPGADDTAFYLELYLRNNGYYEAIVDYKLEGSNKLVLDITEGPRLTIGEVTFPGAESFSKEVLESFLLGPIRERNSSLDDDLPFVATFLDEGAGLLDRFYLEQGYTEAIVEPPQFDYDMEAKKVAVTVPIFEGPRYEFGDIEFRGDLIFSAGELLKELRGPTSKPYSPAREDALARRLQSFYVEQGYYQAMVTIDPLPIPEGETRVPIRFMVEPGPLFTVSEIKVKSTERLSPSFLENRFRGLLGKRYDPRTVDKVYRRLLQTGIFSNLRVNPVPVGDDEMALEIEASEGKTKEFGVYGGYGSYEGYIIGGSYQDMSFFNTGRSLRLTAELTGRGFRGDATWEDWWFLETDINFLLQARYSQQEEDDYSKRVFGGRVAWSYKWPKFQVTAQFLPRHVEIFDTFLLPSETGPTNYFVNSFGVAMAYDTRDNRFSPTRGYVVGFSADYATPGLGSDIEFLRLNYRAAYFIPIGPTVLALAMQGGVIFAMGDTDIIPIDERYFSGGSTTVRSFGDRQLTPRNLFGDGLGGNSTTVFNVEYSFPLIGELRGAVFFDAGNVVEGSTPFSLDDMQYAIGTGLRYDLPVGMFRLDFGVNPDPGPFDDRWALHFGFGFLF